MRSMIIREWTDPEDSMHPGLTLRTGPRPCPLDRPPCVSTRFLQKTLRSRGRTKGKALPDSISGPSDDGPDPRKAPKQKKRPAAPSQGPPPHHSSVRRGSHAGLEAWRAPG